MNKAGDYTDRLRRMVRGVSKDSTGQDVEAFTPSQYLWANVSPDAGRRQDDYGAEQTGQTATIRLRNYPAVSALDRLYRPEWDQTWIIDTIVYGDDETVCACHLFDELEV